MDENINIFCEYGFLEKFCNSCPKPKNGIPDERYGKWFDYFELLCNHSRILITDIDQEDFNNKCDKNGSGWQQILDLLLTFRYDGNLDSELKCDSKEIDYMKLSEQDGNGAEYFSSKEQHIFLLNRSDKECKRMKDDYGLLFMSMDNDNLYEHNWWLFSPDIHEINKTSRLWECAEHYNKIPCNFIILVDNFIYKKDSKGILLEDVIKENLKSLFNSLLPEKLNNNKMVFKITIFTDSYYDKKGENNYLEEPIRELIKSCRSYSDRIEIIFKTKGKAKMREDHDRYLITNYGFFNSGHGFILTGDDRKKGTSLSFFPITYLSPTTKENSVYHIMQNLREKKGKY